MAIKSTQFTSLELQDLGRSFGGSRALSDLNLTIRAGEFIALLGPSGCGKSTALNCLAGLLPLTSGRIMIDGVRVDTLPPEKRDFGMVFQNYALFPHLSVARNIAFGLEMRKVPKADIRRRVDRALALVKLEAHASKLPGQLSGGQQQRVAIARAVILEPRLVLMDEPLSNLDAKLRLEMRAEIRKLHESLGLTTVYVTHDQEEALSMADRLVVLNEGRVQQVGTPEEVHRTPRNWYVADFMGYRNLIDAVVEAVTGREVVVSGGGMRINATAQQAVRVGDSVRLAIRPEDFVDVEQRGVALDGNRIDAKVSLLEYQGSGYAVEVTTATSDTLHVHYKEVPPTSGSVTLTVAAGRALVFSVDLSDPSTMLEEDPLVAYEVGS
jgi:putative spermidine/putrescine transport system ATP-binding protein